MSNLRTLYLQWRIRKTPTQKITTRKSPTHQTPPCKIPTRKIPTQKIVTWNIPTQFLKIPTRVFNFFVFFIIVTVTVDITLKTAL